MSNEPILPSSDTPSASRDEDAASPQLPSQDNESSAAELSSHGQLPSETSGSLPTRPDNGQKAGDLDHRERTSGDETLETFIQRLTREGLGEGVPPGYESPGTYWRSIDSDPSDPFTPLLLDPQQHETITPADIDHHARVLERFWQIKADHMDRGGGGNIHKIYGGPDDSKERVRRYPEHVRWCRDQIIDPNDLRRKARDLLRQQQEKAWNSLQPEIEFAVRGSEIRPPQVEYLLEAAQNRGMKREEAQDRLLSRFREEGFKAYGADGEKGLKARWMTPDEHARQEKERKAATVTPIKIGGRSAQTIDELIDLCDTEGDAAQNSFHNGYIDKWIGGNHGETGLANEIVQLRRNYSAHDEQAIGLELAVRELCEHVGRPSLPRLKLSHEAVNFGARGFGDRVKKKVIIQNVTSRRAWGRIHLQGELPGLSLRDHLDLGQSELRIHLDTTEVQPGTYEGRVLVDIAEAPDTHNIDVRYRVRPVELRFEPETLHLGPIVSGSHTTTLSVATDPEHAIQHLEPGWAQSWDPAARATAPRDDGWTPVEAEFDPSRKALELSVQAKEVKDRRSYDNAIAFTLPNGQAEAVPFSFRRPWKHTTLASMIIGAILFGVLFGFTRQALQRHVEAFEGWMLTPSFHEHAILTAIALVLGSLLLVMLSVGLSLWRDKRTSINS
jgi:hypothetical protein